MLRVLGALLVAAGFGALGLSARGRLCRRVRTLRALDGALEQMERELSFSLCSLPELFGRLAETAVPPAGAFFRRCLTELDHLGEKSLSQIWDEALPGVEELGEGAAAAMHSVGGSLGRYDGQGQLKTVASAREQLRGCLVRAEEQQRQLGRVYTALSAAAGALLAIILL